MNTYKHVAVIISVLMLFSALFISTPFLVSNVKASSWNYFERIRINHTMIDTDLTNFPILVVINSTIGALCDGGDSIRFNNSDNTTEFAYEIGLWNASGDSFVWVNVTHVSSTANTVIWMKYNNSGASDAQNPTGVWDSNYVMVQHMNDNTTSDILDSTSYDNDGTKEGANTPIETNGKIGNSQDFNVTNTEYINCGAGASLNIPDAITISAWEKTTATATQVIVGTSHLDYELQFTSTNIYFRYGDGVNYQTVTVANVEKHDGDWHLVVVSGDKSTGNFDFYLDGTLLGTDSDTAKSGIGAYLLNIGRRVYGTTNYFNGTIDEVRISNTALNSSWITASYDTQNQTPGFITWGSNVVPTQSGEYPTNGTTDVSLTPTVAVVVSDTDVDSLIVTFQENSTGSFVSRQTNTSVSTGTNVSYAFTQAFGYGTKYWWKVWVNDGTVNVSETYHFTTRSDTVTITRVSQTPANIRIDTTGTVTIQYNITTGGTAINSSSIFLAHTVNWTTERCYNSSYRIPADSKQPDSLRACNRNEGLWFEQFNSSGTREIDGIGMWGIHNLSLCDQCSINASGSNWTLIDFTPDVYHLYPNIWYVDRTDMMEEEKSTQTYDVYKTNLVRTFFDMTGTCFFSDSHYNNSIYHFWFYDNYTGAPNDLDVYFANASYTGGDPSISPYCEKIDDIAPGTPYDRTPRNSSYHELHFSTNETGYVGSVNMTTNFSFIFKVTAGNNVKKFYMHYADDTGTQDFNLTNVTQISTDTGATWSWTNGTIDAHLLWTKLDNTSEIEYKMYAQDTSDNSGWSSISTDLLDITNVAPNCPDVITPNGTVDYHIGETVNITYGWLGDPNHETCWVNITLIDNATGNIALYLQNRSITDAETHVNNTWWYNWDTTGASAGDYYINITATDPYGLDCPDSSNGTFNLNNVPTQSGEVPSNGSTGINPTPDLHVLCNDAGNDNLNATWWSNSSGSWLQFASNWTSFANNTNITQPFVNASAYSTTYYWSLNLTDSMDWDNETYNFTTRAQYIPNPPGGFTATEYNRTAINLTWTNAGSNKTYIEWNSTENWARGQGTTLDNSTNTTFNHSGLSFGTTYFYQAWSWNETDSCWSTTNSSDNATTDSNIAPVITGEIPSNTSIDISLQPTCNVTANDGDSDMMDITFASNYSGLWINYQTNGSVGNGSYVWNPFPAFDTELTIYWWRVYADDGTDNVSETYHFTTAIDIVIRDLTIIDNELTELEASVIVENTGITDQNVNLQWVLKKTLNDKVLDFGHNILFITAGSARYYEVQPETEYLGSVYINFTGSGAYNQTTFDTTRGGGADGGAQGGGGGEPPSLATELGDGEIPVAEDTDGDGLSDEFEEQVTQTDPLVQDTDGDGYTDYEEYMASSDPNDSGSTPVGTGFIIWGVASCIIIFVACFFLIFLFRRRRKNRTTA